MMVTFFSFLVRQTGKQIASTNNYTEHLNSPKLLISILDFLRHLPVKQTTHKPLRGAHPGWRAEEGSQTAFSTRQPRPAPTFNLG